MLRRELREKGIDPQTIDVVLADQVVGDRERTTAAALVEARLRSMRDVDLDVATRRLVAMLARKGYSPSLSYSVVREALTGTPSG